MATMKIPLLVADQIQPCGAIYSGEDLQHMAQFDTRYKYEPEDRTLYALIETGQGTNGT